MLTTLNLKEKTKPYSLNLNAKALSQFNDQQTTPSSLEILLGPALPLLLGSASDFEPTPSLCRVFWGVVGV